MKNLKYVIPNFFTSLSLISALFALQFSFEEKFVLAAWLIAVSMFCDGLDGKFARLLNASSKFGMQFDTLSDFVAFGVVPAFLAYKASLHEFGVLGFCICFFYVLCGSFRLVRFSLKDTTSGEKNPFIGLPIPAAGGLIASFIILNYYIWNAIVNPKIFLSLVFISSVLMVSKIEYLPIEKRTKLSKEAKFFILLAFVSVVIALKFSYFVFGIWILIYVFYGIIRHIILKMKGKETV